MPPGTDKYATYEKYYPYKKEDEHKSDYYTIDKSIYEESMHLNKLYKLDSAIAYATPLYIILLILFGALNIWLGFLFAFIGLIIHVVVICTIESSVKFNKKEIKQIVNRIASKVKVDLLVVPQDMHLTENQSQKVRCGDNGIFKGVPLDNKGNPMPTIGSQFLLAVGEHTFTIDIDGAIEELNDYLVMGSGAEVAIGVLENNKNKSAKQRIKEAIQACADKTLYVNNDIKILSTYDTISKSTLEEYKK